MPKLVFFIACEKVLVSEEEKNPSLISIFEGITVPIPPEGSSQAQAAINWCLVSYWTKLPEDEGKKYEQHTKVVSPDGIVGAETNIEFAMISRNHRNKVTILGFPVIPEGEYKAILSIREVGNRDWVDIADYSIFVTYQKS